MKATIFRSKFHYGFKKYVDYVMSKGEKSIIIDSNNIVTTSTEMITRSFILQAKNNKRIIHPEIHLAISFTDDEYQSQKNGQIIIREYLEGMNWIDTQFLAVEHKDNARHHHYHIVLNLVGNYGKRLEDSFCILKSNIVCRKITRRNFGNNHFDIENCLKESLDIALEESSTIDELREKLHMEMIDLSTANNNYELFLLGDRENLIYISKDEIRKKLKVCPISNLNVSGRTKNRINRMAGHLHQ